MALEKNIFNFFPMISLWEQNGAWSIWTLWVYDRIYVGTLGIATYKIYKPWASWWQRRFFLSFVHLSLKLWASLFNRG